MYVNIDKEKQQQKQTKKILGVYSFLEERKRYLLQWPFDLRANVFLKSEHV